MAQSIKLGSNTFLDSTGVVVDNAGTTLAKRLDFKVLNTAYSSLSLINCTGSADTSAYGLWSTADFKIFGLQIRVRIQNFTRTGSNPGISFNTSARPSQTISSVLCGFRSSGGTNAANAVMVPDGVSLSISTGGALTIAAFESYANTVSGGTLFMIVPFFIFSAE